MQKSWPSVKCAQAKYNIKNPKEFLFRIKVDTTRNILILTMNAIEGVKKMNSLRKKNYAC